MGVRKKIHARKILAAAVRPLVPIYPRISESRGDRTTAAASPPTSALPKIRRRASVPLSPVGVSAVWGTNERPPVPRSARSRYPRAPARAVRRDPRAFLLPSHFALRLRLPVVMTLLSLTAGTTRQVSLDS